MSIVIPVKPAELRPIGTKFITELKSPYSTDPRTVVNEWTVIKHVLVHMGDEKSPVEWREEVLCSDVWFKEEAKE